MLTVYNKADLLVGLPADDSRLPEGGLLVSAATGEGLEHLLSEIVDHVSPVRV
jgi:50S ribosomal subunit-associated GTPase HflX